MVSKEVPSELIRAKDVSAFDRWDLPSFEALDNEPVYRAEPSAAEQAATAAAEAVLAAETPQMEDVELEAVKPLTLDELEAIRQDAYNEGFSTGEKDGFHAGQLKAKQEADVLLSGKVAVLEQMMTQLFAPIAEQDQQLERALVQLVSQMSREVIRRELLADSSQLTQVLREALKLLPMGAGNVRIHINPQDFELVKALRERHEENWRILEDEQLQPGGCRVESEHSLIDASIETRLDLALKQLFEQQREQLSNPPAADQILDLSGESAASVEAAVATDESVDAP
ncbi:MAG: flagellar assembly protein FliH [Pseudomonadaceae bacterium]|nr:flagellar assembly protein FliH [Pseudomonadaceae bacterium]